MLIFLLLLLLVHSVTAVIPNINSTNGDVSPCLAEFYKAAYNGKHNCTKGLDFFSNNLTTAHSAFKNGKACVLEIVKKECHQAESNFLSQKYDDFLTVLTTKPIDNSSCTEDFYYKYNGMKCSPMVVDLSMKTIAIGMEDTLEMNDPRLTKIIDMCHAALKCMEPECYYEKVTKGAMRTGCSSAERRNSGFSICRTKLKRQSPDFSPFKCLHGANFVDDDDDNQLKLLEDNKPCVKEVMKRLCGEDFVKNFNEEADTALEWMKLIAELKAQNKGY